MQLRIWKRFYLSPFVRLSLHTRGAQHLLPSSPDRLDFSKRGIRETLHTPVPGVYLSEGTTVARDRCDSAKATVNRKR
jgi:hypothetical protein